MYIECVSYSHCPYAVVTSRSMAIVVDQQLKLITFLCCHDNIKVVTLVTHLMSHHSLEGITSGVCCAFRK